MSSEPSVIYELNSYVGNIILNNPEKGNVVNNDNLPLLCKYLKEAINDNDCRIILIQGKDKVFCRGMDFSNLIKNANEKNISLDFSEPYKDAVTLIRNSSKPVIGKIDGDVLAGGMGIALACDILIATKSSVFGLSEVLFGVIPAYVYPLLLERVTFKKARFLVLSSKRFNAETAFEYGIIDELVDDEKIDKITKDYIKRLLFSSPKALEVTKAYSDKLCKKDISKDLDLAQEQLTDLLNDKSNINAIKAFLEGEKPEWVVKYKPVKK